MSVIFYEPRERLEDNAALKSELRELARVHPDHLEVLAVGDVADFDFAPARAIVRRVVGALARANDLEILFDWSAALSREPFSLQRGISNVLVVDGAGLVSSRDHGPVREVAALVDRVRALLGDRDPRDQRR